MHGHALLLASIVTFIAALAIAGILQLVGCLGAGSWLSERLTRAPLLDVVVASFTWVPWVVMSCIWGWRGLVGALVGQFVACYVWAALHELAHPAARRGPRIIKF